MEDYNIITLSADEEQMGIAERAHFASRASLLSARVPAGVSTPAEPTARHALSGAEGTRSASTAYLPPF